MLWFSLECYHYLTMETFLSFALSCWNLYWKLRFKPLFGYLCSFLVSKMNSQWRQWWRRRPYRYLDKEYMNLTSIDLTLYEINLSNTPKSTSWSECLCRDRINTKSIWIRKAKWEPHMTLNIFLCAIVSIYVWTKCRSLEQSVISRSHHEVSLKMVHMVTSEQVILLHTTKCHPLCRNFRYFI